jgi:hypothetical protein
VFSVSPMVPSCIMTRIHHQDNTGTEIHCVQPLDDAMSGLEPIQGCHQSIAQRYRRDQVPLDYENLGSVHNEIDKARVREITPPAS